MHVVGAYCSVIRHCGLGCWLSGWRWARKLAKGFDVTCTAEDIWGHTSHFIYGMCHLTAATITAFCWLGWKTVPPCILTSWQTKQPPRLLITWRLRRSCNNVLGYLHCIYCFHCHLQCRVDRVLMGNCPAYLKARSWQRKTRSQLGKDRQTNVTSEKCELWALRKKCSYTVMKL